ncbi:MAG: HAMP domain-containing protein [Prevotella sp.]|nr:HAMP domain-containing protein [Prevotella sp.]
MRWIKTITRTLSVRLSLMMVLAIGMLLIGVLVVMFHFSWLAMKAEARGDAEQTLEGTSQQIDNILMSVEQSAGNIYFDMMRHPYKPELMTAYCERLVRSNPYIVGCAIAFKPYYYPDKELPMVYVHHKDYKIDTDGKAELVTQTTFTNRPYTEQVWYAEPMKTGRALWTDPLKNEETEDEPLVTFCLPIYDKNRACVGVLAADVPISLLSQIVLAAKPSPNGYSTLLADNGSYIVHPDTTKLNYQTVFYQMHKGADHSVIEAAEAMVAGEEGYKSFYVDGKKWHVFYKPFKRTAAPGRITADLGWSVGVVYPNDDIFGMFNRLLYILLAIVVIGLLIFFILCRIITHRKLLPLLMLRDSAQRIANGDYKDMIPATTRKDEIGQLQEHFQRMQESLASHIGQLEELSATLKKRNEELADAYGQAQKADRIKTLFLHNMTNQMVEPSNEITASVTALCDLYESGRMEEAQPVIDSINRQDKVMVEVLGEMLQTADNDIETGGKT